MELALQEARKGEGQTSPNPSVGSVIVCADEVVGRGYHHKSGTPHAERQAIADAVSRGFDQWQDATLYVTLEPCSTTGRTGSCSAAIVEKGFKRVVYGSVDPNPAHVGQADGILEAAGISVTSGILKEEGDFLIRGFSRVQREGLPWVIVKSAMSLDGKITRPTGEGQWLTSADSRQQVHLLRAEVDAIITGGVTLRNDDPSLTVRLPGRDSSLRQPRRVLFTKDKQALPDDKILTQDPRTLIYETTGALEMRAALVDLAKEHGINTVLVEAGGGLLGAFNDAGLIDEVVMFYAPLLTGGEASAVAGQGALALSDTLKLDTPRYQKIGDDLMMRASVKH